MGNISILLADDSITIQKVVGIIFAGDGYTLTVVDNGAAAIQKAQEIVPDVLLIDVLMPGMNGYEVTEKLRGIPALATKPVLLLTGSFEAFDEAKAKSCGADDHITKPFESQQIIAKVKELHARAQQQAGAEPPVTTGMASFIEPTAFESTAAEPVGTAAAETMAFEPMALETTPTFEPSDQPFEQTPEPVQAAVSVDDPWGAFTQESPQAPAAAPAMPELEPTSFEMELEQPDVMAMVAEEPLPSVVEQAGDPHIGASWVPVEEQTFEFQEQVAEPPVAALEEEQPIVVPEEPMVAAVPQEAPVVAAVVPAGAEAGAVTLSEEQLKQALMSVSKETIERIVWEVVPDLAEALIKETIRRITEGK